MGWGLGDPRYRGRRTPTGVELGVKRDADYAVLFFADIMHDGTQEVMKRPAGARLVFSGGKPVFFIGADEYELASDRGYRNFWSIYHRPPVQDERRYLLERRDSLLPVDDQKFKGAFYTPLHIVDKAYDELAATLGTDWQQKYIVWDMCAGVGNLEAKHSNLRNVFMSTLDQEDVTIMRSKARFESDFMVRYMAGMAFSPEAQAVLDEGRKLFQRFHATSFPNKIRQEYKLNRADAGWYQVRRALEAYGDNELTDFDPFKAAYRALGDKLRPMVFELGFLPA